MLIYAVWWQTSLLMFVVLSFGRREIRNSGETWRNMEKTLSHLAHLIVLKGCFAVVFSLSQTLRSWAKSKLFMRRFETILRGVAWGFWCWWLLDRNLWHRFIVFLYVFSCFFGSLHVFFFPLLPAMIKIFNPIDCSNRLESWACNNQQCLRWASTMQ